MQLNEAVERAKVVRADGGSWLDCVAATGESIYKLRCAMEPGYCEAQAARVKRARSPNYVAKPRKRKQEEHSAPGFTASDMRTRSAVAPQSVLFERERAMLAPRSLTAEAFGDPKFGRSALDRRSNG